MKPFYFCFLLLHTASLTCLRAQTLDAAINQARKDNKILMMVVESANCLECNEVANKGITSNLVKNAIASNAILLKLNKIPDEFYGPGVLFQLPIEFFGVLFFDADKNILDIMQGSSTSYIPYLDHIDKAVKETKLSGANLTDLKKNYYTNLGNFDAIMQVIEKIRKLNLEPQQQILDELTQKAPEDSANSLSFLQFVARCAPIHQSIAEQYIQKNRDNYNMAWYRMSQPERVFINNRIYAKSLSKAIKDKDIGYAYRLASNRQGTYNSSNLEDGQKANSEAMLQYYKGVHDTTNYLKNVSNFYERFYMNIKVETILKEDSIRKENLFKKPPINNGEGNVQQGMLPGFRTTTVSFSPKAGFYAGEMNNGAWTVYTYTKDSYYLSKALTWVKRGLEFSETPALMDTYARLLYRTGNKDEAVIWEQKAIEGNKKREISTIEFEKVLGLMKTGAVKIDAY